MRYSVLPPRSDSPGWKIVDDRGEIVCSGLQHDCEEWLDLDDLRNAMSRSAAAAPLVPTTDRLPVFDQATSLLSRFWSDSAGEVRVPTEAPAILLMLVVMMCLAGHFVFPALSEPSSLFRGASASSPANLQEAVLRATQGAAVSCRGHALDMACDAADE